MRDWEKRFARQAIARSTRRAGRVAADQADEDRLQEVIYNLLDNAVKYSQPGGQITVRAELARDKVRVSVSDQGVGIPTRDLPRIFERFYRADKARSRELGGTGLGLSIVKHIAQLHGGSVEAESEVGRGTTISVSCHRALARARGQPSSCRLRHRIVTQKTLPAPCSFRRCLTAMEIVADVAAPSARAERVRVVSKAGVEQLIKAFFGGNASSRSSSSR